MVIQEAILLDFYTILKKRQTLVADRMSTGLEGTAKKKTRKGDWLSSCDF